MAKYFHVQKIRSCVQCGKILAKKCTSCVEHPTRKPRVIDFYDWPEILKTAECGCCIQIRCQATGCGKPVWKNAKHNRGGRAISKAFYCSIPCSARSMALARCTRQVVPCAYCSKPVVKKLYALKNWNASFCNNTCYFLERAKQKAKAKFLIEEAMDGRSMLQCNGATCRGAITEHYSLSKGSAACVVCQTRRDDNIPANYAR